VGQKTVTGESPGDATRSGSTGRRRRPRRADPADRAAHVDRTDMDRVDRPGRAGWVRWAVALAAGLVMWPAFPPFGLWPLAPIGVAMIALAVRGLRARPAALLGLGCGLLFFLGTLEGISKIGPDAWIVLSLLQAVFFAPLGAALALAGRLRGWPVWTAALWVAEELARGRVPFGGFPWARVAFSQTSSPFTPYAALGGAPLVSFVTALAGGLLAFAALALWRTFRIRGDDDAAHGSAVRNAMTTVVVPLAGMLALGIAGLAVPTPTAGRQVTVAVVQGNVPRLGLDFLGQRRAVLDNHARQTHELAARVRAGTLPRPELVIWPENSSDLDPYTDPEARAEIDAAVKDIGVPVLVGAVIDAADGEHVENRGIVWDPRTGPGAYYVKRHPVPFGEYLPFRAVLTKMIKRFERIPKDFAAGDRKGFLRLGPARIGDVICFEVAYDGVFRDVASAELLVVQTNNATYGKTSLPPQQIAMSRLRAVEHGRTILVAATSGISAIVAPDGRMIDESAEFRPDIQVARVPLRTSRTLADRIGAAPEWALALLGVATVMIAMRAGRAARKR
jgi:apolipoprotein N-acyltransferase